MNTAYPLIPVTILTLLAYLTSRLFVQWDILTIRWHRKFWNYLLLVAFLISGLLGILSVIKVNYKLDIPHYDTYLKWHVSFGIALVFIAIFHLSWHLKYYFTFKKRRDKSQTDHDPQPEQGIAYYRSQLFLLGFVAITNQVVFIREFISVLSGNELVIGIVMAAWMLLTGWGALHARRMNFSGFSFRRGIFMMGSITLLPLVMITMLYLLKNLLFPPGTLVHTGHTVLAAFLLLFPVCFISGHLFTVFATGLSRAHQSNLAGRAYAIESLGSLVGGVAFSILLGRFFNSFQLFGIAAAIIFLAGAWMIRKEKPGTAPLLVLAATLVPAMIFIFNPDNAIKRMSFPNQELLVNRSTRYGNLVVTRQAGQLNVYENNSLQFYTENVMVNEEAVHFAMVQHADSRRVLLLSGGMAGMIQEIMKYDVDEIAYLESNPEIFDLPPKYSVPLAGGDRVKIVKKDIRKFISKPGSVYDVILMNLPPPSTLGMNRFYTSEFFKLLKQHCTDQTVVCTSLPSTANYAEDNALDANASLWKTLGETYRYRMLLTGEKNYFLASDTPVDPDITKKIEENKIPTEYVNTYYLDDAMMQMRSESLVSGFSDTVPVNHDFSPYIYFRQIRSWLSYFGTRYRILVIIPVILFLFFFFRTDRVTAGLYTGGFTAAALEVTLLLAYQVYFGSIYLVTALFFALFMGGLAMGSSLTPGAGRPLIRRYYLLQFGLALFAIALPFLVKFTGEMTAWSLPAHFLFFLLIVALASGIGFEYQLASHLRNRSYSETTGVNYSTDLLGSAFGAFLAALVLLPLLGMVWTCMVVAGFNILSGLLAFSAKGSAELAA